MQRIVIAGAGPGGLVTATILARAGKSVVLLDPATSQNKVGECVPSAISRLLSKLDLPPITSCPHHRRIGGISSLWGGELRHEDYVSRAEGGGWRLDREHFESVLGSAAEDAGARLIRARVSSVTRKGNEWGVRMESGDSIGADFVIDATGRNAIIARRQQTVRLAGSPLVAVWAIGTESDCPGSDRTLIESTADGWWYGAVLPGGRPIAIYHTSPALAGSLRREPQRWIGKLNSTQHLSQRLDVSSFQQVSLGALDARSSRVDIPYGAGWAACGDAALSFDPLSSQGIFNAMANGEQLASAILSQDFSARIKQYYDALSQIWAIYVRRRNSLYETAATYFQGSPFWTDQLRRIAADQFDPGDT